MKLKKMFLDWKYIIQYSWKISKRIFAASGIKVMLDVIEPFILLLVPGIILDELTGPARWGRVLQYILLLIGMTAMIKLLRLAVSVFVSMSVNECDVTAASQYKRYFLEMDYARMEGGDMRDRVVKLYSNIHPNEIIYVGLSGMLTGLFQLIGYSYLIASLHPLVLLLVLAIVGVNYFLSVRTEKLRYAFQPKYASADRKFFYLFHAMIDFRYAAEVRINQVSGWLSGKFEKVRKDYKEERKKYDRSRAGVKAAASAADLIRLLLMYGYAVFQALQGRITIGGFSVYVGAVQNFSGAFVAFVEKLAHLVSLARYADEHREFVKLAAPSHREKGVVRLQEMEGPHVFEFRNVSFRYPNTERMILKNLSVTIADGEKLAVVGRNGAGKTTFIKLLCRLYEPTEGVILYNGTDISTIDYGDYSRLLSVVFQDFRLFAFPVKDNIVLNQPCEEGRLVRAIRKSGLEERLKGLPYGADTAVSKEFDEEGVEFSGGEGQKLVTARAYYKDAPVVIMDEPTSALDAIAEQRIYEQFGEIMEGKVAVFISHRLASTRFCDRIAVFEDGKIGEYGTHDELMEQGGLYYEMFCRQAEYYREEVQA